MHERAATRRAAVWAAVAGVSHVATTAFGPGFYPNWYFSLSALAYGLLLPVLATLHVRHLAVRQSGAVLGTIAGTAVVTIGIGASASFDLIPAALFVRAIWWWTVGKIWVETAVLPRVLGAVTMGLAIACFALARCSSTASLLPASAFIPTHKWARGRSALSAISPATASGCWSGPSPSKA